MRLDPMIGQDLMARYYANKSAQSNGDHTTGCGWMPTPEDRIYLGDSSSCCPAVREARKHYRQVDGCNHCSEPCHTG